MSAAYCPQCKTRRDIVDTDTAYKNTRRGEVGMPVAILECDHTVSQGPETVTGPAPGAPYAGQALAGRVVGVDPWGLAGSA
jgi:hypothetical protein